jgi:polyisoprenoid-binding protein YceI
MRLRVSMAFIGIFLMAVLAACGGGSGTTGSSTTSKSTTTSSSTGAATSTPATSGKACVAPTGGASAYNLVADQSEASYKVQEQFLNRDLPNDAIGTTKNVQGSFLLTSGSQPVITQLKMTADLRTLTSDQQRRDDSIKDRWLESNTYPNATFVAKDVKVPSDQGPVTFNMTGNMTIHGVTRQETFKVTGKLAGDTITGTATTNILMKNYGFSAPDIAGMLTVKDGVTVTFNFTAKKGDCAKYL